MPQKMHVWSSTGAGVADGRSRPGRRGPFTIVAGATGDARSGGGLLLAGLLVPGLLAAGPRCGGGLFEGDAAEEGD